MKDQEIFYSLSVGDIQTVALNSIQRQLSEREVNNVITEVEKRIAWFDIIDDSINDVIGV